MSSWLLWVQLLFTFCVAAAAVAPAYRDSRAECALAAIVGTLGIVLVPIHIFAWLGAISRVSVLGSTSGLAAIVLSITLWSAPSRQRTARMASIRAILALPCAAVLEAWRQRHISGLGLLAFLGIAGYTLWLAYLAPETTWDGLWYHESIVGYTLEFGGVGRAIVDSRHEYVNGYPALAEYLQLFATVVGGREWIDAVPTAMGCVLLLASYVLLKRFVNDAMLALGFGLAIALVPAVILQFRSTLIDVTVAAFATMTMALLARPAWRHIDSFLAALSIGLLMGTKASAALLAGLYTSILVARIGSGAITRERVRRAGLQVLLAACVICALGAPRYIHNASVYGNPIWPLPFASRLLDLHFPGKKHAVPPDISARELLERLLSPPPAGHEIPDSRDNGYGNALPYTMLPLGAWAALVLIVHVVRQLVRRRAVCTQELVLLGFACCSASAAFAVPALWWARLHLHLVVVSVVLGAWLLRAEHDRRFADSLVGALLLSELVTLSWSTSGWEVTFKQAQELAALPAAERLIQDVGAKTRLPTAMARALEREVGPSQLVAYDGSYLFLANLWNARFDNQVRVVPCTDDYLAQLQRAGARWVIVSDARCLVQLVHSDRWQRVGVIHKTTSAYRLVDERSRP